jgi:hypothetical protein
MNAVVTKRVPARNNQSKTEYLLSELRCAALRARLWQADIDTIGLALKGGFISPDQAVEHLHDCGVLHLLAPEREAHDLGKRELARRGTGLSRRPER